MICGVDVLRCRDIKRRRDGGDLAVAHPDVRDHCAGWRDGGSAPDHRIHM